MAGLSSISGLIAGFDTKGAVDELLGIRQFEINQLVKKQETQTAKQEALATLNNSLLALRNTATGMADSSTFFGYSASLSSSSALVSASQLLDVSGTSSVSAGQHSIIVQQIAQAERLSSSSAIKDNAGTVIASDSTPLNLTGSFQIEGVTVSVSVSDSLQDIAGSINAKNSGATATGVSASVIKVAENDFRLTLVSDATGAAGFTLSGADLDAAGALANLQIGATGQANARTQLQAAQDAQISIDGLTISRSSNQISDALDGITLDLKQADPTVTLNMSVAVDKAELRANVQSFVDAYNETANLINAQYQFDQETGTSGILAGEGILTTMQASLSASLLKVVPGLASDRNSMVLVGVEPDETGQLVINDDRFTSFLNTDPAAIRDVFAAQGSSNNTDLHFLTYGLNSTSGTYSVDITQAATRAGIAGTTDLSLGLAADETVTITEAGSSRQAVVSLLTGQSQSSIISALNAEFQASYTEQHQHATALTVLGLPATGSNTFADLALGVTAGDSITIAGNLRSGGAVSETFTVLDPTKDTISSLLASIQSAYNQEVIASIDANGKITLTDVQSGDSQLTFSLTANNEGAGTLAFGASSALTEGRYSMGVEAVVSGNGIQIQSASYGASSGFSISQSVDGLGIADASFSGVDVQGTINGLATTSGGQLLIGSEGVVDGMGLLYEGTTTGTSEVVVGMGVAAGFDGLLDLYANPVAGIIQNSILSSQDSFDSLTTRIASLQDQLDRQRVILTNSFIQMENAMSTLQSAGSFLTQQIDAQNAAN
ncbi:flagellar hook-associated protein 2 [Mariprofundus micogutta]|uniref:Flagellar hook-associated protein 2 n=1 Tax=Mariprofundus micogutta TaxID=1921010 RepID=A0A1L8CJN0_9PROT|nr:flagellar filament capping protein FliD [Mariprofundus micogutta]GAV19095.1 flagellar hook-associated protein 2 [Mariprofundus micogutta]